MLRRIVNGTVRGGLALLLIAMPVRIAATPERVITVGDRALGIGPAHVYVLRVTQDNLGFRGFALRDTYLLEIALEDGRLNSVWPVQRVAIDEITGGPVIRQLDLSDAVRPFDLLSSRDAYALQSSSPRTQPRVTIDAEALEITEAGPWTFTGETRNILDAVAAGLELTGAAVPAYEALGDISIIDSTQAADLMAGRSYNADECHAGGVEWAFAPEARAPTAFVTLGCGGDSATASVVVPVAAAR